MLASENIDKYISLAGPGETIDKSLIRQTTKQNAQLGKTTEEHLKELEETGEIKNVDPSLMVLFAPQNQPFFKKYSPLTSIRLIQPTNYEKAVVIGLFALFPSILCQ